MSLDETASIRAPRNLAIALEHGTLRSGMTFAARDLRPAPEARSRLNTVFMTVMSLGGIAESIAAIAIEIVDQCRSRSVSNPEYPAPGGSRH